MAVKHGELIPEASLLDSWASNPWLFHVLNTHPSERTSYNQQLLNRKTKEFCEGCQPIWFYEELSFKKL